MALKVTITLLNGKDHCTTCTCPPDDDRMKDALYVFHSDWPPKSSSGDIWYAGTRIAEYEITPE